MVCHVLCFGLVNVYTYPLPIHCLTYSSDTRLHAEFQIVQFWIFFFFFFFWGGGVTLRLISSPCARYCRAIITKSCTDEKKNE